MQKKIVERKQEFSRFVLESVVANAISTVAQTTEQHMAIIKKHAHLALSRQLQNDLMAEIGPGGIRISTAIAMLANHYQMQEAISEATEALYGLGYIISGPTWSEYIALWGKSPWHETHSGNLWNIKNEVKNN